MGKIMDKNKYKEQLSVVYVIDDDEAVRDSMSMLLDSVGLENQTFFSAQNFLDSFSTTAIKQLCGCLILDIRMPGMSGLECQTKLAQLACPLPIIFVTGHGDVPMAVDAMKKGAAEFIQKPFREQELLDCVQQAIQLNQLQQHSKTQAEDIKLRLSSLTSREREVMDKVIAGQSNKVIAIELNLSQRTIEIHRANVMEKMAAKSLADLVKKVLSVEKNDTVS